MNKDLEKLFKRKNGPAFTLKQGQVSLTVKRSSTRKDGQRLRQLEKRKLAEIKK